MAGLHAGANRSQNPLFLPLFFQASQQRKNEKKISPRNLKTGIIITVDPAAFPGMGTGKQEDGTVDVKTIWSGSDGVT